MSEPHFSKSADNNKQPILEQLRLHLKPGDRVLEIASGTGQHALHFTSTLPEVIWQPSDRDLDQYGLRETLAAQPRANLLAPIVLDINHWPNLRPKFHAVYSANCIHVTDWQTAQNLIVGAAKSLAKGGLMMLYGPFKYGGEFTTPSNEDFDRFLKETYPGGGIRDFEAVNALARENGLALVSDTGMPANNQFIVWKRL